MLDGLVAKFNGRYSRTWPKLRLIFLSNFVVIAGWFLVILGLAHVPMYLLSNQAWEGAVSWRKPILFGISTGITLCSLGWFMSTLNTTRIDKVVGRITALALVFEVALITEQQWRGVESHFNQATIFDQTVDLAMLVLITIAVLGILYFTIRSFTATHVARDYRIAYQTGFVFLIVSCVIGYIISAHGYEQVSLGLSPSQVGKNGVAKFPHGLAIHLLQFLPLAVMILKRMGVAQKQRIKTVWLLSIGFLSLLLFSIHQTANGLARFQTESTLGQVLLVISSLLFLAALLVALSPFKRDARVLQR